MDDNFNTIAGWALAAGIAALGLTIVSGQMFSHHHVEKGGYPLAGGETEDGPAKEVPIAALLQTADPVKGKEVFAKCSSCHTINAGGAAGQGPNLHGVLGRARASIAGFNYSADLKAKGGNWDFETLNLWLRNPKKFVAGTSMGFAGISDDTDRSNLIAYINTEGSNLPKPLPPAEDAAEGGKEGAPANATATKK